MSKILGNYKWAMNMMEHGFDISNDNFETFIRKEDDIIIKFHRDGGTINYRASKEDVESKNWKIRILDSLIYVFSDNINKPKWLKQKRFIELIKMTLDHIYDHNNDWMLGISIIEIDVIKEIRLYIIKKLGRYE